MIREIADKVQFTHNGDWNALRQAEKFCKQSGYDYGSMDSPNPIAVVKGDYYTHELKLPHKWHNFTPTQRKKVDGVITGDFRNGPVCLTIYK